MTATAILVPRRSDRGGERDRLWQHCEQLWRDRHPEWPIHEGHHETGPFNRSRAINLAAAAAAKAGPHDVYLVIDADVIPDPQAVRAAVETAEQTGRMVVAHDERIMLNAAGTAKVLAGYQGSWRATQYVETIWHDSVSCVVAVPVALYEQVRGFDELFVGWGREDTGFRIACEVAAGPILRVSGETFHLYHEPAPGVDQKSQTRRRNERRHQRYVAARWNREAVEALLVEHLEAREPEAVAVPVLKVHQPIRAVLYRTVPAETSPEVEAWWDQARALHPGWEHVTYRDPLDPADFPLTHHLHDRCANGAQKAGLVRLELLHTRGGVYLDSDMELFRPWDALLAVPAFAGWEDSLVVPDFVLGAQAGHPVFHAMLDEAVRLVQAGSTDAWETGPGVTTRFLPDRPDVLLLPPGAFAPAHYLDRESQQMVAAERPPWAWGMHHYEGSWLSPQNRRNIESRQRRRQGR